MSTPPPHAFPAPPPSPMALTPEQLSELDQARRRLRKIRRASAWATFDGWSLAVFGGLTLCFTLLSPSLVGILVGLGLLIIGVLEIRFAVALRALVPLASKWLGWNQVALGLLLVGYAGYGILMALTGPDPLDQAVAQTPELAEMIAPWRDLMRMIMVLIYGAVAVIGVIVPGLSAWLYFTRQKHVRDYVSHTPSWLLDLQRRGVTL